MNHSAPNQHEPDYERAGVFDRYPLRLLRLPFLPSYELTEREEPVAFALYFLGVMGGVCLAGFGVIALFTWGDEGNWPWLVAAAFVAGVAVTARRRREGRP